MSEENDGLSSDEDEVTNMETVPMVKEEKVPLELKKDEEKLETKGPKRKLDIDEAREKKENSKKAYIRRVQALWCHLLKIQSSLISKRKIRT